MRSKKAKILIPAAVAACLVGGGIAAAAMSGDFSAHAENATWTEAEQIKSVYTYGDIFNVPDMQVTVGGQAAAATAVLGYPDGTVTLKKSNVLDMTGQYTLTYSATVDGKSYVEHKTFSVCNSLVSIGKQSSAQYRRYDDTDVYGLQVDLAQGERLELSPIIDLSKMTKSDTLFEFFVTPSEIGKYDFEQLIFTLTDADDPNISLRIKAHRSVEGQPSTYFQAGGQNQPTVGLDSANNRLHSNNHWGEWVYQSFYGKDGKADYKNVVGVAYDAQENSVYASNKFVVDFDSPAYFTTLWSGFKSGRVRLGVSADKYASASKKASFMLTKVAGVDLSATHFMDENAPVIEISDRFEEQTRAKVGTPFAVPQATAVDDYSGDVKVTSSVYYNYTSSNAVNIPIVNGKFTPELAGDYAMVYRAKDRAGNVAERVVFVTAQAAVPEIELTLSTPEVENCTVGTLVSIANYTVGGGCGGNIDVKTQIVSGDATIDVDGKFRPEKSGTYTVRYTASDYIGQTAIKEYTLTVAPSDVPVFADEPILPYCLISGSEYDLSAYAYRYIDSGKQKVDATLTVNDADGERQVDGVFTPRAANNGDMVKLTFKAGDATYEKEIRCVVPFIEDGERLKLHMENYFICDGATVSAKEDGITVTAIEKDGAFTFANKLVADGFNVNLRALPASRDLEGWRITITDSVDSSVSATLTVKARGANAVAYTEKGSAELLSGFTASSSSNDFAIYYRNGAFNLGVGTSVAAGVERFESGYVYLTVESLGGSGVYYDVTDINEQPMSSATSDRIKPKIAIRGNYGGTALFGSEVEIPMAFAGDTLDPNCTLTLTVRKPNGEIATSTDGIKLENVAPDRTYTIKVDMYGQYIPQYVSHDTFNERDQRMSFAINIEDRERPSVELKQQFAERVTKGQLIIIPDMEITDNCSEKCTVTKYIVTSSGIMVELDADSNAFRPTGTGMYEVRIIVADESGNVTMVRHNVEVTE